MQAVKTFWNSGIFGKIALSLAGASIALVLGCCTLLGLVAAVGSKNSKATPAVSQSIATPSTPTIEPTAKPQEPVAAAVQPTELPPPTEAPTAAPTDTAEPTSTPEPTDTPEPTSTPEPTIDASRAKYALAAKQSLDTISSGLSKIGELAKGADFTDADWKISMWESMALVKFGHKQLVKLTPPASLEALHNKLTDATGDCDQSMDHLATGMDTLDADEIETATEFMNSCNTKIEALVDDVKAEVQN